ncbi:MAG: leucyl/phenylalanyl-tRNA--protein transferase [Planctomycetes bacterium]|nr:leucyl/phenylalanyl-tRNA--protein transferase [Planctomycetota bacterium]
MTRRFRPQVLAPTGPPRFPDPRRADAEGLVAVGGALSPPWLLEAYRNGIFPWYELGVPPLWWSPDPRAVFTPDSLHVSRSLARTIRRGGFTLHFDTAFVEVMQACAEDREDGTWILPEMIDAYAALHRLGHAHSVEVRVDGALAAGLYGVQIGGFFAAESKFHRVTDLSKVALVAAVRSFFARGIALFDVQLPTEHLNSLGAVAVPRASYLELLARAVLREVDLRGISLDCGVGVAST